MENIDFDSDNANPNSLCAVKAKRKTKKSEENLRNTFWNVLTVPTSFSVLSIRGIQIQAAYFFYLKKLILFLSMAMESEK